MSKLKLDAESYLKTGSNELRVLEYRACGMSFGINILKVNKIVNHIDNLLGVPETHPAVKGVFKDMNRLIPVVDLGQFLGIYADTAKHRKVIVTEFFGTLTGFLVDQIDWIHHFQWQDVIDAQNVFSQIEQKYVIGIVKPTEERMVQLLDYETILLDLCPNLRQHEIVVDRSRFDLTGRRILVADDSPAVRAMLVNEFSELGCDVVQVSDGNLAWTAFQEQPFDAVVCDVEMPQMDGLALTLRIRQSERAATPVVVYSSIGDMGMKSRAKFLKADAHVTKLNFERLLSTVTRLMNGEKIDDDGFESPASDIPSDRETVPLLD